MEETAYRQFVELEETHFWFVGRRRIFFELLDRELGPGSGRRVVDVGCGAGGMLGPLSRYGEVTGIEPSEELAALCRERGFERVINATADEAPIEPQSVDLVALFDTIEHIADDLGVLRRCREWLVPGGLLVLSVPAYQFLYANNDRVAHHERRYTRPEVRRKLAAAGFEPGRVSYFNTLLFPAIAPAVLTKKLTERWFDPGERTNLSHELSPRLNGLLAGVMSSERRLVSRVELPFGHSIVGLARRPAA